MPRHNRSNWLGRLGVAGAIALLIGAFWHARQMRLEQQLANLGGEVSYSRRHGPDAARLGRSANPTIAREAPRILDRLFGRIVAVDFGRVADLGEESPQKVVAALREVKTVEVLMIDGLPLSDARLLELGTLPALRQLGLNKTKVTAEGVAALKRKRPDIEVKWLDAP